MSEQHSNKQCSVTERYNHLAAIADRHGNFLELQAHEALEEIGRLREGLAEAVAGLRRARSLLEDATDESCRKAGLVLRD